MLNGVQLWDLIEGLEANDLLYYTHLLTGIIYKGEISRIIRETMILCSMKKHNFLNGFWNSIANCNLEEFYLFIYLFIYLLLEFYLFIFMLYSCFFLREYTFVLDLRLKIKYKFK